MHPPELRRELEDRALGGEALESDHRISDLVGHRELDDRRAGDDRHVAHAGEHERRQREIDHRLVVYRQQLLADCLRRGVEPRAAAACEDNPFHASPRLA